MNGYNKDTVENKDRCTGMTMDFLNIQTLVKMTQVRF
jgi:hypothetical protein